MKKVLLLAVTVIMMLALIVTGCGGKGIVVGSKIDTEGALLSQMIIL
ncbi:MAG: ABC transporter substrate-binding protein, partial [Armatimonadetes bacterium]|nr:ABC transporter substrate-binding protein [Armatimonadota bacterium]NIO98629.1 ABC transporter substrate-binding protein [Armatimonadota bacterium]